MVGQRPERAWLLAAFAAFGLGCSSSEDELAESPTWSWTIGDGPLAPVSGRAFVFGPSAGASLEGATVAAAEAPEYQTTVGQDGSFELQVPSGAPVSFRLDQPGFYPNQSATLPVGPDGVTLLGFQAPTESTIGALAIVASIYVDPELCQISTTVSRAGTEPYGGVGLGEPDVVVTIEPDVPTDPIYFEYADESLIYPDPDLMATTIDGGVVIPNVPPGEYRLTAIKEGMAFTPVDIRCRAGTLVNAAPPHGLQEI